MGGAASISHLPMEIMEQDCVGSIPMLTTHQLQQREVLASVRRRSITDIRRKYSISNMNSGRRNSRLTKPYEIPSSVVAFLEKIGFEKDEISQGSNGQSSSTTKLIKHIFDCLGALQHLVKANQSVAPIFPCDETMSIHEKNVQSVGKMLHEMLTIYALCGDTSQALLNYHPDAAGIEDSLGRLPLHVIIDRDKPWTFMVQNIIEAYPMALQCRDGSGRLPIHVALDRPEINFDIVKLLIDAYPDGAKAIRGVGRLPIHYAVFTGKPSLAVIDCLVQAYPEGLRIADVYGRLPLHYAVDKATQQLDVIRYLTKAHPDAVRLRDNQSKCPLNICLDREDVNKNVLQILISMFPESLSEPTSNGKLPLLSAIENPHISPSCVYYIASSFPLAVTTSNGKIDSPIASAIAKGNKDIIRALLLAVPSYDPQMLANLNWEARKIGLLLALKFQPPIEFLTSNSNNNNNGRNNSNNNNGNDSSLNRSPGNGSRPNLPRLPLPLIQCDVTSIQLSPRSQRLKHGNEVRSEIESTNFDEDDEDDEEEPLRNFFFALHNTNTDIFRLAMRFL